MILKLFATKDTFITNHYRSNNIIRATGSNMGASEILDVFARKNRFYGSGIEIGRILVYYNLSSLDIFNIDYSSLSASIKLHNTEHSLAQPTSFNLYVHPITTYWDEGNGLDHFAVEDTCTFENLGYANWKESTSIIDWTSVGGDFNINMSSSMHFDTGYEDLECNISNIFVNWLTGSLANYGLMVKLGAEEETNDNNYFIKMFYSVQSHNYDKRPYLELYWNDLIEDDRAGFIKGISGSLFIYNKLNDQFLDLPYTTNNIKVKVTTLPNQSGSLILSDNIVTKVDTGIYKTNFLLSQLISKNTLYDYWYDSLTDDLLASGSFTVLSSNAAADYNNLYNNYVVSIANLRTLYHDNELTTLRVFVTQRRKDQDHIYSQPFHGEYKVLKNMYYEIVDAFSKEKIIPVSYKTQLSRDKVGNFFTLAMQTFTSGKVYRIQFYMKTINEFKELVTDEEFLFKIS